MEIFKKSEMCPNKGKNGRTYLTKVCRIYGSFKSELIVCLHFHLGNNCHQGFEIS